MASSTASKDRKEREDNSNKQVANEIKNVVKEQLGLKTNQTGGSNTQTKKYGAYNLKGKDIYMYGNEASKMTNDEMVKRGLLSYNKNTGGYSNVVDGKIISNANAIKYGASNSAMGSGDPTGAMTSIPLSERMLQSQNKFKGLVVGALSLGMPSIGATAMRASAGTALINAAQPEAAYDDYKKGFDAKQSGKKFTSQRNVQGIMNLGLTKGKKSLKEKLGL
tara:strand:+ start:56 stop:718 length:663 start_codon:yes stop_codon:yes gene_type:complete